ncbi:MAG: hypothetical protein E6H09_04985 [Bacteroidetes bacterium]|jgi:hypothetical protein|nr:MAG: hypothetical protein E6H09_04985 [Bacteroidota bacterium]
MIVYDLITIKFILWQRIKKIKVNRARAIRVAKAATKVAVDHLRKEVNKVTRVVSKGTRAVARTQVIPLRARRTRTAPTQEVIKGNACLFIKIPLVNTRGVFILALSGIDTFLFTRHLHKLFGHARCG